MQPIDAVGEEADLIGSVVGNTLSLENESPQHTVVALVCALLVGRIRTGEVHLQIAIFQKGKPRKLRTVVAGNGLEPMFALLHEVRHDLLQSLVDRLGGMVASLAPDAHPRHALHKRENTRLVLALIADDSVDLPMTELGANAHDLGAFFAQNELTFSMFCGIIGDVHSDDPFGIVV